MKRLRSRGAWRLTARHMTALAAAIAWFGTAGGQALAQFAPTSPAMAKVTVPPASEEPPPPPPLDTAEPAPPEPPAPAQPPPEDYRADLFEETQPDAEEAAEPEAAVEDEADDGSPQPLLLPDRTSKPASEPAASAPRIASPVTLPAGSGLLDSATAQRAIDRLVALHFLASPADAQNPETLVQAIRDFQASIGISPSGTMDRDTVGRLTLP